MFSEADLKAKKVQELKELAKQLGLPTTGKKDELIAAVLAAQTAPAGSGAGLDAGTEAELVAAADGAAGNGAVPVGGRSIVFALDEKKAELETAKKANLVAVKVLSDQERSQLRAAKFGASLGVAKVMSGAPAAAGAKAAGGGVGGLGAPKTLEEQIKILERGLKYGTTSEADQKKLEALRRQQEAVKEKQRLALDKVELMDPEKLAAREKKFGKPLLTATPKNVKDPEAMRKRAEKFGKPVLPPASGDDDARKKARLERFAAAN